DDRGYVYLATLIFGWGIVSDPGGTDGSLLPSVAQVSPGSSFYRIFSLRHDSTYYACVSLPPGSTSPPSALYNVTTPAAPSWVRSVDAFTNWTKYEAGERVALRSSDGHVRVYTYADFIAGNAPLADVTPSASRQFADLSFDDEGNLWIAESGVGTNVVSNSLWKLSPSGNGYTTTTHDVYGTAFSPLTIHAAAGYIAVGGRATVGSTKLPDLRLLRVTGGTPALLDTDGFFLKYYAYAPSGYAQPGIYASILERVRIVAQEGKTYLFYNTMGLGDVFELGDEDRITSMTPLSGIPAGGTNVSIYGTGFAAGTSVTFDGILAGSTFVSPTEMTAVSPMHASGSVDVVVSPPGAAPMTAPRQFTYLLTTPQSFTATATSTTTIDLSWSPVAGATFYEVSRRQPAGTWDVIGTPATTSFTDGGRTAESTYVYRVRAGDAALNYSDPSAIDLATTMSAESSTIVAGTPILALDIANLRTRVNAVRAAANLSATSFTGGGDGEPVLRTDLTNLRDALSQARLTLGLAAGTFTDKTITAGATPVKALHLNEILDLMR
ncbi:MAG TPA: IPT/TIG domain-containing protein, partial [Thermoanaerobaculia bacterium]|nr:IPT/TIG domain-containing protein [Thermoanaerobaculia bacterium]